MNLAIADVVVLHRAIEEFMRTGSEALFDSYADTVLKRVWKAQHFSWWMTSMLHAAPGASDFDQRRRIAELASVTESRAGSTFLAEAYTGWPLER
jgi:p-hydroxybenzoate 3-monooxygenase